MTCKRSIPVKQDRWKIAVESLNGKKTWRYFSKEQVDKAEVRKKVESIPSSSFRITWELDVMSITTGTSS